MSSTDNESEIRRAAIVLRDMCAFNSSDHRPCGLSRNPELELEGIDANEVYPGNIIGKVRRPPENLL